MIAKLLVGSGILAIGSLLMAILFGVFGRYDIGYVVLVFTLIGMSGMFVFGTTFTIKTFLEK